jgi:hypothetical protein
MTQDDFSWYVTDFRLSDWEVIFSPTVIGNRSSACGIHAVLLSFRSQYPDSSFGYIPPAQLLGILDKIIGEKRMVVDAQDEEMEALIKELTKGGFTLCVVQRALGRGHYGDVHERARRVVAQIVLRVR